MSHIVYAGHNPLEISAYQTTKDRQQPQVQSFEKPTLVQPKEQQASTTQNVEFERRSGDDRRQHKGNLHKRFDSRGQKDRRQIITLIY